MRHPPRALRDNALKACCVWVEPDSSLPSRSSRMTTPSRRQLLQAVDPVDDAPMAPVRPKPGGSPAKNAGSPAKETGSGAKDSGKVSKENPSANWAFSMGYDDPAQKPAFSRRAPLLEAARSATGPLYPWFLIIARKSRALMALSVGRPVCCSFVEPLPSWPGLSRPSTPGRRKNESRLGATGRKADGRKAFRACLRRCAGPSWMAGTSPAMTP